MKTEKINAFITNQLLRMLCGYGVKDYSFIEYSFMEVLHESRYLSGLPRLSPKFEPHPFPGSLGCFPERTYDLYIKFGLPDSCINLGLDILWLSNYKCTWPLSFFPLKTLTPIIGFLFCFFFLLKNSDPIYWFLISTYYIFYSWYKIILERTSY